MLLSTVRVLSPIPVTAQIDAKGLALMLRAASVKPFRLVLSVPPATDVSADVNVEAVAAEPRHGEHPHADHHAKGARSVLNSTNPFAEPGA